MPEMKHEEAEVDADENAVPSKRNWLSFWSLLMLQAQNAFNDKAAQFLLIPIGGWLVASGINTSGADKIEHILAAVIVLPFILFSPLSGWLTDRFSKTYIARAAAIIQLVILVWISACIYYQQLWLAIVGFFILAIQSVILSPAKRGLVKELVGHKKLGMASGLLEISVVLAMCAGQIITGFWFTSRVNEMGNGWEAAFFPMLLLTAASVATLIISFIIEKVPVREKRPFSAKILTEHIGQLRELLSERALRLSAFGVAFFWGYAGFLNLAAIGIAKQLTGGEGDFAMVSAVLMFAASLGVILGGAIASLICRRSIELGLVPLGGVIMIVGSLALAATPLESDWLKLWLLIAGMGGAMLLVPLNANIQDLCPPEKRGRILAGLGLLDCLVGLIAVLIQLGLTALNVPFSWQFAGLAVVCVVATHYATKILPQHVVRMAVLGFVKLFYRVKTINPDNVPQEGGVLMVSNHVTYMDAFILSAASPRKVRFLMFDGYFKRPWIGKFVRLFDTVPISQTRAKEALKVAADALEEGYLVCIFPEGQLSRTGCMNEFKRGFEMIARKAKCPVLPAVMDGLWGSIFSFERGKFLYKIPYRVRYGVTVKFGETIPPREANADRVRSEISQLRLDAFKLRRALAKPTKILNKNVTILGGKPALQESYQEQLRSLRDKSAEQQKSLVANALQVGDINAIGREQTVMIEWTGLTDCRDVIAITFAQYFGLKLVLVDSSIDSQELLSLTQKYEVDSYIGGETIAKACQVAGLERQCYDFSPESISSEHSLPCLAKDGQILSMSMPHPVATTATNQHQDGYRDNTWGRLLPGYHLLKEEDDLGFQGVCNELTVSGITSDVEGFIQPIQ